MGAYANGLWVLDVNGNFVWDPPIDQVPNFGGLGITPVVGAWKPYDEPQPPAAQRMDFSAPPAAAEGSCGPLATNPNCTRGSSLITFVGQTQMYGTSRTYTTGPDRYKFYNFTSNGIKDQNGSNLGFACGADATSFGDYFAEARVPCSTANFLINVLSSRLYKLDGLHRAQAPGADSGIFHTYYSLGLVAAGSSWDPPSINVGSFSDATTAAGPFVAAGSGGVTARYNSRTQTTVALHIDVPYSAVKGKIDFSFPTVDVYGNASSNQVFSLIVYDDTPHIDTPSPLLAGTQSALTIRGTGFGDHPTVYVDGSGCTGGTAYNPGLPSRINGQDVVTVQVNLPISKAGTSVPVCVKSNGAGGHVFVGAPQGTAQGLPTSNTVQLALQGPPTISGNPGIWWFAGVVPECGDPTVAPCYFTSTLLTVTLGPGGTVPTASAPAVWRPTANESKVSISCTDQSCGSVVVTAVAATVPDCNDSSNQTQIVVTLSGFASPPFYVKVDTPAALEVQQDWVGNVFRPLVTDFPYNANGQIGYTTYIQYFIRSGCGVVMTPIRTNEFFTQNTRSSALFNGVVNNWPFIPNNPINQGFNGVWDVDKFATDNTFTDTIAISDYPPGTAPAGVVPFNPTPQPPPADQSNPGTFMGTSNVWLTWQLQTFRVGSLTQGLGNMVQLGDLVSYLDHARVLPSPPQ